MIDSKTVDLIIRAQLEGKADLASVTKGIKELEKALEAQSEAAKKGESSIDELRATLLSLQKVQQNLKTNASLVKEFDQLPERIDRATRSVDKAKTAYDKLAEKQKESGKVTEEQAQRLFDLGARYENAQKKLESLTTRQGKLREELTALGADTKDLAGFQRQLVQTSADLGVVINKTDQAIASYGSTVRAAREAQRELAQQQAQTAREAAQFEAAERRAAAASEARAAAAREVAEAQANRRADSAAAGNQFNDEAAAATRARELAQLRADIVRRSEEQLAVEKQLAKSNSLAKTADDAQQAARQYTSLARASSDLSPKVISVRSAVESILNPSKAATSTLQGLEGRVGELSNTISQIKGPVKDYRETLAALTDTQRSLASQANLIDAYQRQVVALRAARDAFSQARAKVAEYAAAVRAGGDDGEKFVGSLTQAQAQAQRAAQALQNQIQATRETREALRTAGIASNDLANAQTRLLGTSRQAADAANNLGKAVKEYGIESENAGRKSGKGIFGDEGRTTLSLAQRIRGEILALTASYVGLQGAISTATSALEAYNNRASTRTVIGVGLQTTDKTQIDAEYAYIKQQADRIGLVFQDTSKQYSKFAASAAFAGRPRDEIRFIFESFSEAGRVLNLTQDNLNGVFTALEQIFSKGKISAEELRQQLGERLPAVFQVAQKALQDQFPDLNKAMEKGQVGAENLVLIAQKYREMVGGQLPDATKSLAAQQARLTNSIEDFKLAIADAGFVDAYANAIGKLSEFLKSDDGKKFAENMAGAFKTVLDVLLLLLNNFDALAGIASAVVWISSAKLFLTMATGLGALVVQAKAALGTMGKLQTVFAAFAAGIVAFEFGTWLYKEFASLRVSMAYIVTWVAEGVTRIQYAWKIGMEEIPRWAENMLISVENIFVRLTKGVARLLAQLAQAVGADDFAKLYTKIADGIVERGQKSMSDRAAQLRKEMDKEIAQIRQIQKDMVDEAYLDGRQGVKLANRQKDPTPFPGKAAPGKTGPTDAEVAKAARQLEALEDRLLALEGRIERSKEQTLAVQLQGVDKQTKDLRDDIEKQVKDTETKNKLLARVDAATAALRLQTTEKFNRETLTAEESIQRQLEEAQAAAGKKQKENLDARLEAIKLRYEKFFREADELIKRQQDNGLDTGKTEAAKARMTENINELQQLEAKKFYEEEINRVIKERQIQIDAVRAAQQAGNIDQDQAAERINQINAEMIPLVTKIKDESIQWALANAQIFGGQAAVDAFIAKLNAIAAKTTNVKTELGTADTAIKNGLVQGVNQGLQQTVDLLGQVLSGQMSVKEGFAQMGRSAVMFLANFMKDLAIAMIKLAIFNAMKRSPYAPVAAAGAAGAASVNVQHTGGIVGGSYPRSRLADPSWFNNAPRYHSGGISGLAPSEYPAILQKNEEVLRSDDPRNILNGGAAAGGAQQSGEPQSVRFVLVDDRAKVAEAMNSTDGEKVILQVLQRNAPTLRQMVRS